MFKHGLQGSGGDLKQRGSVSHLIPEVHVHLIGSIPNGLTVEYMPWLMPLFEEVPQQQNGELVMPTAPGLGLKFNKATLDRYRVA